MDNNKLYCQEGYENSILDVFWYIIYHWRILLISMLIMGMLLGGYGGYKEYSKYADKDSKKQAEEEYNDAMQAFTAEQAYLETKLDSLNDRLKMQEFYETNSIILLVDPYQVSGKTVSYYIDIHNEAVSDSSDLAKMIAYCYKAALDQADYNSYISTEEAPFLNIDNPVAEIDKQLINTDVNPEEPILSVQISADSKERVEQLWDAVRETIEKQEKAIKEMTGDHQIYLLSETDYVKADMDFLKVQTAFHGVTASINEEISASSEQLTELKQPELSKPGIKSVLKKIIKYGLVGGVLGLVVFGLYYLCLVIIEDKLINADHLDEWYHLPVLGMISGQKAHKTKLDTAIGQHLGIQQPSSTEDQVKFIVSNIELYRNKRESILLIGSSSDEQMKNVYTLLSDAMPGVRILMGGNALRTSEALEALQENSLVILVETWNRSIHKNIQKELRLIAASGKELLGFILTR